MLADDEHKKSDYALNCIIPGCEVSGSPLATCVIWGGRRMCYFHFAAYHVWSADVCPFRAPSADEWAAFVNAQLGARAA